MDRTSLELVLNGVQDIQNRAKNRLTRAIPYQKTLSHYEARLLLDLVALPDGLLVKMSIPLASRQTVLDTFEAIPIPMPQLDDSYAMIWSLEADF